MFEILIRSVYSACLRRIASLIPGIRDSARGEKLVNNAWFVEQLMLTSVQLVGKVGDTGIPISPDVTVRAQFLSSLLFIQHFDLALKLVMILLFYIDIWNEFFVNGLIRKAKCN